MQVLLVVGGGDINLRLLKAYAKIANQIIAADGGADSLLSIDVVPDVVIGDMDSISPQGLATCLAQKGCEVIKHLPEKDQTDGELVMDYACHTNAPRIVFMGALGDRLDHSMANIYRASVLAEAGIEITLVGSSQEISFASGTFYQNDWPIGSTISIIAVDRHCHVQNIAGFKYPLCDKTLLRSSSLAISNEVTEKEISITIDSGMALVIRQLMEGENNYV